MLKSVVRRLKALAVFAVVAFALISGLGAKSAKADPACVAWADPFNAICTAWAMPPGGHACTSNPPAAHEVYIYSQINYGGVCAVLPHNSWIPNLDSNGSGWRNSIRSIWHGSSEASRACNGLNFAPNCSDMGGSWGPYFPNTAGSQNWGSIQTG